VSIFDLRARIQGINNCIETPAPIHVVVLKSHITPVFTSADESTSMYIGRWNGKNTKLTLNNVNVLKTNFHRSTLTSRRLDNG
jgi:hypothetical protein